VPAFRILVICIGNVCRSPLAERLLQMHFEQELRGSDGSVRVRSAGVLALVGDPMNDMAADQLRRLGGDPAGFVSTQLTSAMVEDADLVLTASRALRSRALEEAPRALRRTFTLREFAALATSVVLPNTSWESAPTLVRHLASWRGSVDVGEYDVPDPMGQPIGVHQDVANVIDSSCTEIARALSVALAGSGNPAH
jgi:protein-tyrosine phosphatase